MCDMISEVMKYFLYIQKLHYWNRKVQIHPLVLRRESLNILRTFRPRSHVSNLTQILVQISYKYMCQIWQQSTSHACEWGFYNPIHMQRKISTWIFGTMNDNRKNPPADPRHRKLQIRGTNSTVIWGSGLQWKFTSEFKMTCEHTLTQPYKLCPSKATNRGVYRFIQLPLNSMLNLSSVRAP